MVYIKNNTNGYFVFRVIDRKIYPYQTKVTEAVFAKEDKARLNLITCYGTWLPKKNTYNQRLVVFTELVWVLLLAIEIEPPPDPKEPLPEFDANAITGAAPIVSDAVETIELEKLGAVATGIITGVIDVAVV